MARSPFFISRLRFAFGPFRRLSRDWRLSFRYAPIQLIEGVDFNDLVL